jgi:glycine/D-amino acid oxidase-like deaminating enzyme
MNSADVLVVGCRMQGAGMALCAARLGLRPLVLERNRPTSGPEEVSASEAAGNPGNRHPQAYGGLDDSTALPVPPRSEGIARGSQTLLRNPDHKARIGRSAASRVRNAHSISAFGPRPEEAYACLSTG